MSGIAKQTYEKIKSYMIDQVKPLNGDDYEDVLHELATQIEGMLDAHEEDQDE